MKKATFSKLVFTDVSVGLYSNRNRAPQFRVNFARALYRSNF